MIQILNYRSNGGPEILLSRHERTFEEALRQLVQSELGFGGWITKSSETLVEVRTDIMSCRDRTVFMGPKEEMEGLLLAVILWEEAEKKVSFDEWWHQVSQATGGVPLLVKLAAPMIQATLIAKELEKIR